MAKRKIALLLVLVAAVCGWAAEAPSRITIAGRDVTMWAPAGEAPKKGFPVIVFSHGFGGCSTQSKFLMTALAQSGYFVLAQNHADARCQTSQNGALRRGGQRRRPQQPFRDESAWSDATYQDRRADMEAVLNAVLQGKSFEGVPVDRDHIGLAGHSLGGYTVLGLAGGWSSWKDGRVKAVLALSPYCSPYSKKGDLEHLNVPVMYQGGTRDFGVTPTVKRSNGAYDLSSTPKFYVEFEGAGHFAWTDLNPSYQQVINEYSVAFFDRYLKGEDAQLRQITTGSKPQQVSLIKAEAR